MTKKQSTPQWQPFFSGAATSMITAVILHPADLVKVRMQLSGEGIGVQAARMGALQTLAQVAKTEGLSGVYKGLSASLVRQATAACVRVGVYNTLVSKMRDSEGAVSFHNRVAAGVIGGACGAFIGTPADVVMVRMQADGSLPHDQRRNYKNAMDGLVRLVRDEGFSVLWKGCGPTVIRAVVVTASQLVTYDVVKDNLTLHTNLSGVPLHFMSSMVAGFSAAVLSSPVDVIKTRLMTQTDGHYKNAADCLVKTVRSEGPLALYKGFLPNYLRIGPQTILNFIIIEQVNKAVKWAINMSRVEATDATVTNVQRPAAASPTSQS